MKTVVNFLLLLACAACTNTSSDSNPTNVKTLISKSAFGNTSEGPVELYTLKGGEGIEIAITNYGGIVQSILLADKNGEKSNIVLGFESIQEYLGEHPYFGAIIGRYGNRIAKGKFVIDEEQYELAANNGPNHLHGGIKGFDKVIWNAQVKENDSGQYLELKYRSLDMEEGYPGNLDVTVNYSLAANQLKIDYLAVTDQATHVNLTNHSYFNLSGADDILSHELMLAASKFTPVDSTLIPTGELAPVSGTAFDFTKSKKIGDHIGNDEEQIRIGNGYDHNYVIDEPSLDKPFAIVYDASSGREIKVYTTEPGVQFYSGNFLDGSVVGFEGKAYQFRSGFCLETQHFPDSPNQANFPGTLLSPGEEYKTSTIYEFTVR